MLKENDSSELNQNCLSVLTKLFVKEAQYARITKEEAITACGFVLKSLESGGELKECLFSSLLSNKILVPSSEHKYLIRDARTQGILVNLTKCYSPLCNQKPKYFCYSSSCPNRVLENIHLNILESSDRKDNKDQWTSNIPRYILENLSSRERKRQLAIEELLNYEDNFLKQLTVIRDVFARPLVMSQSTVEESRRYSFHDILFGNYHILASCHRKMLKDLELARDIRNHNLFPDSTIIGNLLYKHFSRFKDPYIQYVTNHVLAKYQYNLEYNKNAGFVHFIEQQEAIEKDFRIPLKGLLISPIVRLPKYDLLFSTILRNSEEDQQEALTQTVALLADILHKINEATRSAEAEQRIREIRVGLRVKRLSNIKHQNNRQQLISDDAALLFEGSVYLIKSSPIPPAVCQLFLFDNVLLITRKRTTVNEEEEYILIDRPIPIHMIKIENSSRRTIMSVRQQVNILSSIRRQLSSSKQQLRHSNSDRTDLKTSAKDTATADIHLQQVTKDMKRSDNDTESLKSDDSSSIYSGVYTLSGLKLRHRIRIIKLRMTNKKNKAATSFNNGQQKRLDQVIVSSPSHASPILQKSATYPMGGRTPQAVKSRLFHVSHAAYPELNYLFECPTLDNRLKWKKVITSILPNPSFGPFGLELLCNTSNYSNFQSVNGRYATGCGTIWCSLPFLTSDGRGAIALGTRYGLWVAYDDASELFKQVLPYSCHQLELFDNKIILVRGYKPSRILGAIAVDQIYPPSNVSETDVVITNDDQTKGFQVLQKSGVLYFAIGTLRGESILCYLRRRRTGSIRLVLMIYRHDNSLSIPWFKKIKEYKPMFIQPIDLKIIDDYIYIRSRAEGVEKIDLLSWVLGSSLSSNGFQHPRYSHCIDFPAPYRISVNDTQQIEELAQVTVGYVPLNQPGIGLICSTQFAFPITDGNAHSFQQVIELEASAKSVMAYYPYLIAFSSNVIEIRHLETTSLVQVIAGNKIRCLYISSSAVTTNNNVPIIHISMFHVEEDQTKVYQLYLKEPLSS
ncbi:MAG: hypothetical protein EXX96DRAFT_544535 [Benjaminiella poitrasii]|nr:MAG: hypothetical protein EXX96DRAFT_544535 [Benjaminiella poitrasii]